MKLQLQLQKHDRSSRSQEGLFKLNLKQFLEQFFSLERQRSTSAAVCTTQVWLESPPTLSSLFGDLSAPIWMLTESGLGHLVFQRKGEIVYFEYL